jgi:ATP-dependent Clp protease protease subunit
MDLRRLPLSRRDRAARLGTHSASAPLIVFASFSKRSLECACNAQPYVTRVDAPPTERLSPARLIQADVRLYGEVEYAMFERFREGLEAASGKSEIVIELTTLGGDADIGRRIAGDIEAARKHLQNDLWFVGRTAVYSAGVTIMAAFPIRRRVLSHDAVLLIHERKLDKQVHFRSGLQQSLEELEQVKAQIELGLRLEREGFAALVRHSGLGAEEVAKRALTNWYLGAGEALQLGLIDHVIE